MLIIGLGNPILGDDGIGWKVAEQISMKLKGDKSTSEPNVEVDFLAVGGLGLMERLVGYKRVIIVDAITTNQHELGSVLTIPFAELPNHAFGHLSSAHDTTLQNALAVGRQLGAQLPDDITIVAIEAQNVYNFSTELSPVVAEAVPKAVQAIMELISPLRKEET